MHCPWCDYDLRGLHVPVRRCPECGERPVRTRLSDPLRAEFWPPIPADRRRSERAGAYARRAVAVLLALEAVGAAVWAVWMIVFG